LLYYYLQRLQVIPEITSALAIYISLVTAGYTAIAKPNPNKSKKQEIYGQLKKSVINIISNLENKDYHKFSLEPWHDIQVDERHQLVNKKLRNRLDNFSEKIDKYGSVIDQIDFKILKTITQDVANEIYKKEQSASGMLHLSIRFFKTRGEPLNRSITIYDHLKKKHTIEELIDFTRKEENLSEEEIKGTELELQYYREPINDEQKITVFWNQCLERLDDVPEYKFIVKQNDVLLEEAKKIKEELIKRIEKAIE